MPPLQQINAGQKLLFGHDSQSQLRKRWQTILSDCLFRGHFYISKGPCKRSQHCWPTRRNIVGPNMLRAFAHHVVCCCVLLRLVATCWMKFETGQTSSNTFQQVATTHNMVCKCSQHVGPNNVASCWPTMLRAFARALNEDILSFKTLLIPSKPNSFYWKELIFKFPTTGSLL